ncbi:cytochrome P450 [Poronia punctata]|nr:cytochrome P450 [Poronia punctata]
MAVTLFIFGAVALLLYVLKWQEKGRGQTGVPPAPKRLPGPKSYPFIGRVHDVPHNSSWLKFYEWSKQYGPIYQTEMFGKVHVWISSERIANDLLSRRAGMYSDRPQIPNLPDNRTKGDYLALTGHNDTWRRQRKLAKQLMTASANLSLHDYPSKERDRFLYLFSTNPSQYRELIEQFTSRTVARLCWGSPHSAQELRVTTAGLLETISPAGALPNVIWWLMYLPRFLSPWQKKEGMRHRREAQMLKDNIKYAHEQMESGSADPSFFQTFVENEKSQKPMGSKACRVNEEGEASYVVGQMAIAGALTIGSPIQSFILAMLHYPSWQQKLQEEISRVCGGACPEWDDRAQLPLLRAVVKEVIRWRPPVPTGIPHALEKDDVYEGYHIPAGATIHALEWAIARDPAVYPDPETFNPARWLEPSYPTYAEPLTTYPTLQGYSQFGFGRRTCQGLPLVEQDLYLAMGGLAWAFNIVKKRTSGGEEVAVPWNEYTPLLIAKPVPFEFEARVRDEAVRKELGAMWYQGRGEDDEVRVHVDVGEVKYKHWLQNKTQLCESEKEGEDDLLVHVDVPISNRGSDTDSFAGGRMEFCSSPGGSVESRSPYVSDDGESDRFEATDKSSVRRATEAEAIRHTQAYTSIFV